MKILKLNLLAFGPFTEALIGFAEGKEGLNIVYGPNEAGKSSALRALRQMLYGIPVRSPDDFIHPYAKMRIGGVLQHSDGTVIEVVRRKGKVNTLRGRDDEKLIEEAFFQKFLGNIDDDVFATMFGIGHEDLVRGGEEIIGGGGDVGQALFAAGAGISDLRKVQIDLQTDADAIFTPSASKRPINEAISDFRENQRNLREAQLPGQEWERHDKALSAAMRRRNEVDFESQEIQTEKHRLERIREGLPLISKRKGPLDELGHYSGAVLLPEDFGERRNRLLSDLRIMENKRDQAQDNIKEISKNMEQLAINEAVLDKADMIEAYYRELGSYQKAAKDKIQIQTRRDVLWGEAREILSGLRDDLTLEESEKLRLKKSETVRIQELSTEYERLMTRLENEQEGVLKLTQQIKGVQERIEGCETSINVDDLKEAIEGATKYGALEDHYESENKDIESIFESLETALRRQTLFQGTLEDLNKLPLPSIETIDIFDHEFDEAQKKLLQIQAELSNAEDTHVDIEGQLKELELEREVPTEDDLKNARGYREEGWRLVRSALENSQEPSEEAQAFIASNQTAGTLTEVYEVSVQKADEVSDRLRREADRVAKKAKLISDQETQKTRIDRLKLQETGADKELNEIRKRWSKVWDPVGISPQTPREMRAWVQDQAGILKQFHDVQERRRKADDLKAKMDSCRGNLDDCLHSISELPSEDGESLTKLISRCRKIIEKQENIRIKKEKLLSDKKQKDGELNEVSSRLIKAETDISNWQSQWEGAIQPLGLDGKAIPAQANAVMEDLKSLFEKLKEADVLHKRLKSIDRDAEVFTTNVTTLVDRVAQDFKELPVEQAASELNTALNRSRTAKAQFDRLEKQRDQEQERVRGAEQDISGIRSELDTMCEEARCSKYEDLAEAERRSSKRRQIEANVEDLEGQLHKLSAGATIDDFVAEALAVDPDGIEGQIGKLNEKINALNEEKSDLDQTIGEERNELRKMDGSAKAAELAEANQGILARLERYTEKYARLRIASAVLAQAIERYREKHQGPILKRTNEIFANLTLGFFEGIRAEFDENGNPVLMGVRPGGKELVGVNGMSDGTTDQLYLSLRLSSLESYLDNNEPMPFIVDDILIKFDNERAIATLKVLAELSKKTQVIFFTHHHHLVELAEASIESSLLFNHALETSLENRRTY